MTPLLSRKRASSHVSIPLTEIKRFLSGYVVECRYRQLSPATIASNSGMVSKLVWWLEHNGSDTCGRMEIQQFLSYVGDGHTDRAGRWGKADEHTANRPSTLLTYHARLSAFFTWLETEEFIEASPMENVKPPIVRRDQIQPFTEDQVSSLLEAAKEAKYPKRDLAILLFLLDTGVRASELCGLRMQDIDLIGKKAVVLGKGNKHRAVFFSRATGRALNAYLRGSFRGPSEAFFGSEKGGHFTPSGLFQLVERLGHNARVGNTTRCSPHTFRHTAAIWFLRSGGNVFSLQQMLGHADLKMTSRYVALAEADVQCQHIQFSPVERLKRGGR